MAENQPNPQRPAGRQKRRWIVTRLRDEIIAGTLPRGQRLPSHAQLARRFAVSPVTVEWALQQLVRDGFVRTRPRSGTFVSDRPPHLANYALAFYGNPHETQHWSKYYAALTDAARELEREDGVRVQLFHDIDQHVDTEDYQRLYDLVMTHRLSGLIFANAPHPNKAGPLVTEPGIPRAAFTSDTTLGMAVVDLDSAGWTRTALEYLHARGCRRMAVLTSYLPFIGFSRVAAELGLVCPPWRQQLIDTHSPQAADHCVQLLMQGSPRTRPDGLLITDDNLVDDALAGLIAAGIRVPHDIEVVAHANFPLAARAVLPVRRLGYDARTLLRHAMVLIDRQQRHQPVDARTLVGPVWEDDRRTPPQLPVPHRRTNQLTTNQKRQQTRR